MKSLTMGILAFFFCPQVCSKPVLFSHIFIISATTLHPLILSVNVVGVLTTLTSVSNAVKWMPLLVNS